LLFFIFYNLLAASSDVSVISVFFLMHLPFLFSVGIDWVQGWLAGVCTARCVPE
jgi:hypothetical protein